MIVTPLYAGLLGLWFLLLSFRVIGGRRKGISLGDGGSEALLRKIRGHGNFAEYVPLILVMMGMLEVGGLDPLLLHVIGITLVLARVLHGVALSFTQQWMPGRFYGTLLTFIVLLAVSGLCIWQGVYGSWLSVVDAAAR